jgi:hypothetical protein
MTESNLSHSIRKQEFEVEFNGTESEGLHLQRSLTDLCHNRLIPAIEHALDRYVPTTVYLTIDRLDIDAGTVTLDRLERDLPQMVDRALGKYFQKLPQADSLSDTLESAPVQRKTRQQTISAAFIYFLKHGTLPWSFHLPSGSGFEELIQGLLTEREGWGSALELFKNEVIKTLASATARKRLIQQFTPALLDTVLALISTEGKKVISGILALLRRSDVALIDVKRLEQDVWESAFASIASGSPLTETFIRRETQALVMALGVRSASLAPYWSDVPKKEDVQAPSPTPVSSLQRSDGGAADEEQKVVHDERTMHGSVSTEEEGQLHPEACDIDQAKLLIKPTNPSRHSEGANEAQKGVHDEKITHDSASSDGEEQLHPQRSKTDQANFLTETTIPLQHSEGADDVQLLKARTDLSRQFERSVEKEKEIHHQSGKRKESISPSAIEHPDAKVGIYTALAGLVLLHPFLPQLFRALGIADYDKLLQPDRAIYLLYFLATGRIDAKEYELVIPKMLCHFPLERALGSNIIIATAEQEEGSALIAAVIRHWEVLKNTSVEGLQETFLKRSGKLSLLDNGEWLLQVESNACDILLEQLPWGISMIKLPWMPEMLRVEWV